MTSICRSVFINVYWFIMKGSAQSCIINIGCKLSLDITIHCTEIQEFSGSVCVNQQIPEKVNFLGMIRYVYYKRDYVT